jgi:hypothetical protein
MEKETLLNDLWNQYKTITPSAEKIHNLLSEKGEVIENDHIAIRTYNDKRVNIDVLEKPFLSVGYEEKGTYVFDQKKLVAKHYEHKTDKKAPKIFISELELEKCSLKLKETVTAFLDNTDASKFTDENLIINGRVWEKPSYETYNSLREESEYAAWMYVFGFRANHFTINVNALTSFEGLEDLNMFVEEKGWNLNASGGKIKGTPEQMLQQSSTLGDKMPIEFVEGLYNIPTCYYEFAYRYNVNEWELFNGFIASSADKIFESTDLKLAN